MKSNKDITEITLKMIVESRIIIPGTSVYSDTNPTISGIITKDGEIILTLGNKTKTFPYPSGAARAVVNLSVNGWTFWKVIIDNELKELSYLRKLFFEKSINPNK